MWHDYYTSEDNSRNLQSYCYNTEVEPTGYVLNEGGKVNYKNT